MFNKISKLNRFFVLLVLFLMISVFFFPVWSITLSAPQYPEKLGMHIWVSKIVGHQEFDLKNINILNHYIGMAPIDSNSVPEFKYISYFLYFEILFFAVCFLYPIKLLVYLGFLILSTACFAGLYDFYSWGYNYGHNLNPNAPISIPGMAYQPPTMGCKQILNITSCSWPSVSGILIFICLLLLFYISVTELRKR